MTRTVRSRFEKEVGGTVEGCIILEKRIVIPPNPAEQRRGVYEYVVEAPPAPMKPASPQPKSKKAAAPAKLAPESGSFTRATPDERGGVVRRLPSR